MSREEAVRFEADLLGSLGRAVIATDLGGTIRYWNAAAEQTYGWSAREAVGQPIYHLLPAALADDAIESMMEGFRQGRSWAGELVVRRRDGTWIRTFHHDSVFRDEKDAVAGVVSISDEVTRREDAAAQRREQLVPKDLLRQVLVTLGGREEAAATRMRQLGRDMARRANCPGLTVFLATFAEMGLGDLRLESADGNKHVFHGVRLLEATASSSRPTCHLPLGFLEGAVSTLAGRDVLGTETACQSQGAPQCVFQVHVRPGR